MAREQGVRLAGLADVGKDVFPPLAVVTTNELRLDGEVLRNKVSREPFCDGELVPGD